ncbi:AAA family ATPase [Vallitalea sediminicola]
MLLKLKDIGRISNADIKLDGITVIAGENNTGKSTVGKALFCIFNSFFNIKKQINRERKDAIGRSFESSYHNVANTFESKIKADKIVESIFEKKEKYLDNNIKLRQDIKEFYKIQDEMKFNEDFVDATSDKIIQILNISDNEVFKNHLQKKLKAEYNGQINNIYSPENSGEIYLKIKNSDVKVMVKNDVVDTITNNFSLKTEVIYIDDPFALDDLTYAGLIWGSSYVAHREHLKSKLSIKNNELNVKDSFEEIIAAKKLDKIFEKINTVCNGEMVKTGVTYGYKKMNTDEVLDIKNISTGLKTFVILKTLLLNGSLEDNGTIVLDEPEIHLHPEWQLLFAELIILIQKEFNMHILLNTHSPYFLNAIEVYAAKYGIKDKCKYYLAENVNTKSIISDVTNDIERIYEKLARPFQNLENERYSND